MNQRQNPSCEYCGTSIPPLAIDDATFDAAVQAFSAGSKTLAVAEITSGIGCSQPDALTWVNHLLRCTKSWPYSAQDRAILATLEDAFGNVPKPCQFTDYQHCDECETHDRTLRAAGRDELLRAHLGNPGWDPIGFCLAPGIGYLFPALARFALMPDLWRDRDWYGGQLLSHLGWNEADNRFFAWCSPAQRNAVRSFIVHLETTRRALILRNQDSDTSRNALDLWK